MEIAAFLVGVLGTAATLWGVFSKTDKLLIQIRDVLVEIRDQRADTPMAQLRKALDPKE